VELYLYAASMPSRREQGLLYSDTLHPCVQQQHKPHLGSSNISYAAPFSRYVIHLHVPLPLRVTLSLWVITLSDAHSSSLLFRVK